MIRGTIIKKPNGRYYVAVNMKDPGTGKYKQTWHGGYRRKGDAQRTLTEILSRINGGGWVSPDKRQLGMFLLEEWLPAQEVGTVRASTLSSYKTNIRNHILPSLGAVPLQSLTASMINGFYAELRSNGRLRGSGPLSAQTIRHNHMVLRKALSDAQALGYIMNNPADGASPPQTPALGSSIRTWAPHEIRVFLEQARAERLEALWFVAATTGLRRGEILGGRWQDVDLDSRRWHVRQALVAVNGVIMFSSPKTARSRRTVPLDDETVGALRRWRQYQQDELGTTSDPALVFTSPDGRNVSQDGLPFVFRRLARSAGLPRIRFHDLRHSWATNALLAGVAPKVVSDLLGHSTVAFTMDVYAHSIPSMQEDAMDLISSLVWGETGPDDAPAEPDAEDDDESAHDVGADATAAD